MKRSNKCIGFLILSVLCVPLFLMSSDTSALKHEYDGIPLLGPAIPHIQHDTNNYIDWNNEAQSFDTFSISPFQLQFEGNSWDDSYYHLKVRKDLFYINSLYNTSTGKCESNTQNKMSSVYRGRQPSTEFVTQSEPKIFPWYNGIQYNVPYNQLFSSRSYNYIPEYYQGNKYCWSRNGMTSIDKDSYSYNFGSIQLFPNGLYRLGPQNGLNFINDHNVFPYNYMTDTLSFTDSHKQSDGIVYNKRFSFNVLFDKKIKSFSYLSISLDDYGGYWYDDTNLFSGRDIDFHFLFSFDESVSLESTFINGGTLKLHANSIPKIHDSQHNSQLIENDYNCTSTIRVVGDNQDYYWDIHCPVTLDQDYIVFVPSLAISGNGNKVFTTDGDWYFSSVYIVTDNDDTLGRHFNDSPTGNTNVWDSYWAANDNQSDGAPDWLQSILNMFTFGFINPFAPIFQMFSDNNSCAQIPILSSMLHSEETQVCPWFDSTTRNIVTPVVGLASMMLIFGFAVRWLGSSSGNLFEDSGQHDISDSSTLRSKWRKK